MARVQPWKRRESPDATPRTATEDGSPDDGLEPDQVREDVPDDVPGDDLRDPDALDGPVEPDVPAGSALEPVDEPVDEPGAEVAAASRLRLSIADSTPVTLFRAAHPKQAVVTALAMGAAALLAGRPAREAALVTLTVLVGQTILGWHNDLVDRERDADHRIARKPVAEGRIEPGNVWYALTIAVLLVIPLSISTGVTAGTVYLVSLIIGILGNVVLRRGWLSWLTWAASFALYPAYLSYGGFGGGAEGDPPTVVMTVLAALLGIGIHFLRSIWGLVADDEDGWTYLPLVLGRRLGATRLLVLSTAYTGVVLALLGIVGATVGLRQ